MRCIAANRSILTAIDQNATLPDLDDQGSICTAMTNEIDSMDTIQFADGWYSYPDLNTFDSDLLLDVLTIRVRIFNLFPLILFFSLRRISKQQRTSHHGMSKQRIPAHFLSRKSV